MICALHNLIMQCIFFINPKHGRSDFMSKVTTNKKLELVKAIRMQNQYNRQLFRSREGFLYSDEPLVKRGELYSLEAEEKPVVPEDGKVFSSFRIRFVIAVVLLAAFILCDINHLRYGGETTDTIYGRLTRNVDIGELFDFQFDLE